MPEINEPADAIQIEKMCELATNGMQDGALGISTGLAYPPGNYASQDELVALLKIAGKYGGIHATHMRNEGKEIVQALNEVIEISQYASIPLLVSHFKITGLKNCGQYDKLLDMIKNAKFDGMQIYVDQYPYDASSTDLNIFLPDWYLAMNTKTKLRILRSSIQRAKLKRDIREIITGEGFKNLKFATISFYLPYSDWQGKNIDQIAQLNRRSFILTMDNSIDIIIEMESHGGAEIIYHSTCQDVMDRIPIDFENLVSTDSAIRYGEGKNKPLPHPRGWGAFPRFLKYFVNEKKLVSLDDAIFRMTSLPAEVFGLKKRGVIKEEYFGDIVLFDSKKIRDEATYENPFLPPIGIIYVLVNGKVVVNNEKNIDSTTGHITPGVLNVYPGKYVRREKDS
jgi:N-acyl-D-amino-acid deacylase